MKDHFISRIICVSMLAWSAATFAEHQLTLQQLPAAVQNTVKSQSANGPVKKIEQLSHNGKTIYEIGFAQPNGLEKDIYLDQNGLYVQDMMATQSRGRMREVALSTLPQSVQKVILSETSNGPVKNIELMPHKGQSIYKVAYQKPNGEEKVIYLNKDGSYVQDTPQTNAGKPAGSTSASRASLSAASKVTLDQLPLAAQNTIKANAGGAAVEDIDKGTLNGKTVYEAAFKQNGQTVELRVDEAGQVIPDTENQTILSRVKR